MWNGNTRSTTTDPWNKGKLIGQKLPLTQQEIWSIRLQLTVVGRSRDLALFNLAIDSKLRACDLLKLRLSDLAKGGEINSRAAIVQQKTRRPVRFELTARTRESIASWVKEAELEPSSFLFPSRVRRSSHLSTRQYAMSGYRISSDPDLFPLPIHRRSLHIAVSKDATTSGFGLGTRTKTAPNRLL